MGMLPWRSLAQRAKAAGLAEAAARIGELFGLGRNSGSDGGATHAFGTHSPIQTPNGSGGDAPMLSLADVRKRYAIGPVTTEVLKGVDLEVRSGDLLSIMGASGSGKSTLMNIMGLLDRPSDGSCRIGGHDIKALDDDELSGLRNRSIGFVFQSFLLLPRLTAWENVALPLTYRGGLSRADLRDRAEQVLDKVAIRHLAEHRPTQLSGGQQQRVAIARALVGDPTILLADEPTGALDPDTGRAIMELFMRLNAEDHVTVVVITHDRAVARQCARNARIEEGVIVEERTDGREARREP